MDEYPPHKGLYDNGNKIKANISVYFEFSRGTSKEYLSKIIFKDLVTRNKITFHIDEYSSRVKVTPKDTLETILGIDMTEKTHNIISYSSLPFYKIDNENFIKQLIFVRNKLKKDFGLTDVNTLYPNIAKEVNKTKDVKNLMTYYLYFDIIPLMFDVFYLSFHLPQLRTVPQKSYILEDNTFKNNEYYNILNKLYKHQESIVRFVNLLYNKEPDIKSTYKHYSDLIKFTNKIRRILSDRDILLLCGFGNDEENKAIRLKVKKTLSKEEEFILTKLIEHNNFIDRFPTFDEIENNWVSPSFISNISFNVNYMISKLGFEGSVFISKDEDIGRIYIIKDNYTPNYILNESSGLLQLLPILIGHCMLIESYEYNAFESEAVSFQGEVMLYAWDLSVSVDSFNSLYIEQPELHLHPKLQTDYIDILLKDISRFNPFNNVIIETHSEHILKKVQIEIAKDNIDKNTVSVFYFDNDDGTTAKEMRINNDGFFDEQWPKGFFDESYKLTKQLLFAKGKNGTTNRSDQ